MKTYISVFDNIVPLSFCDSLISKFDKNYEMEQEQTDWENRHFMEVNLTARTNWAKENDIMVNIIRQVTLQYMDTHSIVQNSQWPKTFGYEQIRMKRYLPNGRDEFSFHTDVGGYSSARRFLAFLFYLNDVPEGGKTVFSYSPDSTPFFSVTPKRGSVLMFPPLWTYPHWGEKVVGGPKYIVSAYLHYL